MIKKISLFTPPVMGRISIGRVVEKDGKRLPQKGRSVHAHQPSPEPATAGCCIPLDETLRRACHG